MTTILTNDGKYEPYEYTNEEELEKIVIEHAKEIFGENCLFFPKKLIQNKFNTKTIPDGFLADIKNKKFYIVEVERNEHDFYGHIQPQISKFRSSFKEEKTKRKITEFIYTKLNDENKEKIKNLAKNNDSYKFLHDIVFDSYGIIIVIDYKNKQIEEELEDSFDNVKIIELKTYKKVGDNTNHIHLFSNSDESNIEEKIIHEKNSIGENYNEFFGVVIPRLKEKLNDNSNKFKTNTNYKHRTQLEIKYYNDFKIIFVIDLYDPTNNNKNGIFLGIDVEEAKDIMDKNPDMWKNIEKKIKEITKNPAIKKEERYAGEWIDWQEPSTENTELIENITNRLKLYIETLKPILDEFLEKNKI